MKQIQLAEPKYTGPDFATITPKGEEFEVRTYFDNRRLGKFSTKREAEDIQKKYDTLARMVWVKEQRILGSQQ